MIQRSFRKLMKTISIHRNADEPPNGSESSAESSQKSTTCNEGNGINSLTTELIVHILSCLPGIEAARFRQLSKRIAELINDHRLLENNLFVINWANYAGGDKHRISISCSSPCLHFEVNSDGLFKQHNYGNPSEARTFWYRKITDRLYEPGAPKAGEEFLRKFLPLSRIVNFGMHYGLRGQFSVRFFEIVAETRCPIKRFTAFNLSTNAEKILWLLKRVNFLCRQNVHFEVCFPKGKQWDVLQELASISNLSFTGVKFRHFIRLLVNIIEKWLADGLEHPFLISCNDKDGIYSSGELMKSVFLRSDISFEGITLQEIRKMNCIRDLPDFFRIVKTENKSFITFTKNKDRLPYFVVNFYS